eukprot:221445_1
MKAPQILPTRLSVSKVRRQRSNVSRSKLSQLSDHSHHSSSRSSPLCDWREFLESCPKQSSPAPSPRNQLKKLPSVKETPATVVKLVPSRRINWLNFLDSEYRSDEELKPQASPGSRGSRISVRSNDEKRQS